MKNIVVFGFQIMTLFALNAQEIDCNLIHTPVEESDYILPYSVGETYAVTQSNCHPTGGHFLTFAYDFNTQLGDIIVASRAGLVVFVNDQYADTDWTSGHENNVFIEHSDGTRIRYTHLKQNSVLVNIGQSVEQGQAIGLSGNSGNTGGFAHLHIAAFNDGSSYGRENTIPLNFRNTNDPVDSQNLLIEGQSYTALEDKLATEVFNLEKQVVIYPNPASDYVYLDVGNLDLHMDDIQIFNTRGASVQKIKIEGQNSMLQIPLNNLSKGLYFVVISSSKGEIIKKLFIE